MLRLVLFISSLILACFSSASESPDFASLNFAQLSNDTETHTPHYRVVLSSLKTQQAQTFGEQEQRINGKVWRRSWVAFKEYNLDEISTFFLSHVKDEKILYQCQNLDCGSSQFWANQIFDNPALLGRDNQQRYFVALKTGTPNKLYVFYAAQRHTGKIRFHLDIVSTAQAVSENAVNSQIILQALTKDSGWLSGFYVNADGSLDLEKSKVLITTLNGLADNLKQRLYLLVQYYQRPEMRDNLRYSQTLALELKKHTKIDVRGQGALTQAPDKDLNAKLRFVFWPRH